MQTQYYTAHSKKQLEVRKGRVMIVLAEVSGFWGAFALIMPVLVGIGLLKLIHFGVKKIFDMKATPAFGVMLVVGIPLFTGIFFLIKEVFIPWAGG